MSNVVIFKAGQTPQYLTSVNTPDYINADTLINPDLSAVKDVPLRHWKRDGDKVVEMSTDEKLSLMATEQAEIDKQVEDLNIGVPTLAKALVASGIISETDLVNAIKEL